MAFPPCAKSIYFPGKSFRKTEIARTLSDWVKEGCKILCSENMMFPPQSSQKAPFSRLPWNQSWEFQHHGQRSERSSSPARGSLAGSSAEPAAMISNRAHPALTLQLWVYGNEQPGERQQFIHNPLTVLQNRANSPHRHQQHQQRSDYPLWPIYFCSWLTNVNKKRQAQSL